MKFAQSCLTLYRPHGLYGPWNSPVENTGADIPSPEDLPNTGTELGSPALQRDSYQQCCQGSATKRHGLNK